MQDEVNEKTIALYIKTGKLTAQTLQKAMKAILSKGKKQLARNVKRNILSFRLCKSCKRFFASLPKVARSDGIISMS